MWTPLRISKEFKTKEEWDAFVESVARAALVGYFNPHGEPVKTGAPEHGSGIGHRARWSAFADMSEKQQLRDTIREVERMLRGEADDDAKSFEPRPGWWQPEARTSNDQWSTKLPHGYSSPHVRQGRAFAISYDDRSLNLEPFKVFYVDDQHAGLGPLSIAHGVWSLDFFTPDGIVVNDDGQSLGGPYMLRFKKISDPLAPPER